MYDDEIYFNCEGVLVFSSKMFKVSIFIGIVAIVRFDISLGDQEYHQETLENLRASIKSTKKLCAVCFFHVHSVISFL